MTDAEQAPPADLPQAGHEKPAPADPAAQRRHARIKVSKAARISFANGTRVYNCLVLDESQGGMLVEMGGFVAIPEEVVIQYSNGAVFRALRRQTNGTRIGLQFAGSEAVGEEAAAQMRAIGKILDRNGLAAAAEALRAAAFFNSHELRRLTEEAETAHACLKTALGTRRAG